MLAAESGTGADRPSRGLAPVAITLCASPPRASPLQPSRRQKLDRRRGLQLDSDAS
jgi:hypothetical protein